MFEKVQKKQANSNKLRHIAFIMDGNGRWAKKQGKPRTYGHYVGAYKIEDVVKWCADRGLNTPRFMHSQPKTGKGPPKKLGSYSIS